LESLEGAGKTEVFSGKFKNTLTGGDKITKINKPTAN
jgi:hypothetical protein